MFFLRFCNDVHIPIHSISAIWWKRYFHVKYDGNMKVISGFARLPSPPGLLLLPLLLGPIMLSCSLAAEIRPIFHQLRRLTVHGCCTLSHTRHCSPQPALATTWLLVMVPIPLCQELKTGHAVFQVSISPYFAIPIASVTVWGPPVARRRRPSPLRRHNGAGLDPGLEADWKINTVPVLPSAALLRWEIQPGHYSA